MPLVSEPCRDPVLTRMQNELLDRVNLGCRMSLQRSAGPLVLVVIERWSGCLYMVDGGQASPTMSGNADR